MLTKLFGDITLGRLARLPFLGYSLLLNLIWVLTLLGIVLAIGAAESFIGGDLQQAQQMLTEQLSLPFFIIFIPFSLLLVFAGFNITAKRIRDIGLPGWKSLIIFIILAAIISFYVSPGIAKLFNSIFALLLLFVPGNKTHSVF